MHRPGLDPSTAIQIAVCAALTVLIVWGLAHAGEVKPECYDSSTVAIWGC